MPFNLASPSNALMRFTNRTYYQGCKRTLLTLSRVNEWYQSEAKRIKRRPTSRAGEDASRYQEWPGGAMISHGSPKVPGSLLQPQSAQLREPQRVTELENGDRNGRALTLVGLVSPGGINNFNYTNRKHRGYWEICTIE